MKILAVSDMESAALWDHYVPGRLDPYDLILSCGDLKAPYLSFLVTMSHAKLLYVHGNHDGSYDASPPEGCENIDGHLVVADGVRILGLGGSLWYNGGPHQYTEREMQRRVDKLRRAIRKAGGADIAITHAPPRGFGDLDDPAHRGFEAFLGLMDACRPKYLLHGHTHLNYGMKIPRVVRYGETEIVNVMGRCELEWPAQSDRASELIWISRRRKNRK